MDTTTCPECGEIAEVQWRTVMESTDGPVEHSRVLCLNRHWFLLPTADLERPTPPPMAVEPHRDPVERPQPVEGPQPVKRPVRG